MVKWKERNLHLLLSTLAALNNNTKLIKMVFDILSVCQEELQKHTKTFDFPDKALNFYKLVLLCLKKILSLHSNSYQNYNESIIPMISLPFFVQRETLTELDQNVEILWRGKKFTFMKDFCVVFIKFVSQFVSHDTITAFLEHSTYMKKFMPIKLSTMCPYKSNPSPFVMQQNQSNSKDLEVEDKQFDAEELESRIRHVIQVLSRIFYTGFKIQEMDSNDLEKFLDIWGNEIKNTHQLAISNVWNQVTSHVILQNAKNSEQGNGEIIKRMEQVEAQLALSMKKVSDMNIEIQKHIKEKEELHKCHTKEKEELNQQISKLKKEKYNMKKSLTCAICFQTYVEGEPVCLGCGHIFCNICIENMMKQHNFSCPICRAQYSEDSIRELKGLG